MEERARQREADNNVASFRLSACPKPPLSDLPLLGPMSLSRCDYDVSTTRRSLKIHLQGSQIAGWSRFAVAFRPHVRVEFHPLSRDL